VGAARSPISRGLFGAGGVYDDRRHLRVEARRHEPLAVALAPGRWNDSMGTELDSRQLGRSNIRQQFFKQGGRIRRCATRPTPGTTIGDVRRLVVGGRPTLQYSHGPQTQWRSMAGGASQIAVTFIPASGPGSAVFGGGATACSTLQRSGTGRCGFVVTIRAGAHTSRLRLDASSIRNRLQADATRFVARLTGDWTTVKSVSTASCRSSAT
jgi:hypothetical protein